MPQNRPIILAHGIARFDFLTNYFARNLSMFGLDFGSATDRLHYFKGVGRLLRDNNFDVYHSSVGFAPVLAERAADLKREVEQALRLKEADKAHIIAHSMGGLDARYMIVRLGMADRVASLTTVGTPHHGTSLADYRLTHDRGDELIRLLETVIDLRGFRDLTTDACRRFNAEARHSEATNSVVYQTYSAHEERSLTFTPLQAAWQIIFEREGANDGLVPVTSQQWTPQLIGDDGTTKQIAQHSFPVPADHLNEVGWCDLSELRKLDLRRGIGNAMRGYEERIRNVYLNIARALPQNA